MALESACGTFTKDTSGTASATQDVTLSFTPKAVLVWATKQSVSEADAGGHASFSVGFSDGVNNGSFSGGIEDGIGSADAYHVPSNTRCLILLNDGLDTVNASATIAFSTNKFTVTWPTNSTVGTRIHYVAWGGSDITGVQVGSFAKDIGTAPVTQSVPTDADVQSITAGQGVLFIVGVSGINSDAVLGDFYASFGFTDGTNQGSYLATEDDGSPTSDAAQQYQTNLVNLRHWAVDQTSDTEGAFAGFTASGFDILWDPNSTAATLRPFMIIKGGKWQVGNHTAKTGTTGTQAYTTSFQPEGVLVIGQPLTAVGISVSDVSMILGAADGTNHSSGGFTNDQGPTTMVVGHTSSITKVLRVLQASDQAVLMEAGLSSFNATDFTLDFTTVGAAHLFTSLVWADAGASPQNITVPVAAGTSSAVTPAVTAGVVSVSVPAVSGASSAVEPAISVMTTVSVPVVSGTGVAVEPAVSAGQVAVSVPVVLGASTAVEPALVPGTASLSVPAVSGTASAVAPAVVEGGAPQDVIVPVASAAAAAVVPAVTPGTVTLASPNALAAATAVAPAVVEGGAPQNITVPVASAAGTAVEPPASSGAVTLSAPAVLATSAAIAPALVEGGAPQTIAVPVASATATAVTPGLAPAATMLAVPVAMAVASAHAPVMPSVRGTLRGRVGSRPVLGGQVGATRLRR